MILPENRKTLFGIMLVLDVTFETRDAAHAEEIFAALAAEGYKPVRVEPGR
jgi:hypothetical protein